MTNTTHNKNPFFLYCFAAIVGLGGILFGYDTGVISGAIIFIRKTFILTTFETEITVSAVLLGALVGAFGSGELADYCGRRTTLLSAAVGFIIGSLLSAFAIDAIMLIISRFIVGLAIGVASFVVPLYISEIAPVEKRGGLVILNTIAVTGGIVIAYFVDWGFSYIAGWRWMLGVGMIPALIMGLGLLTLPRSPRWLMKRGLLEEAKIALQKVRSKERVEKEIQEIAKIITIEKDRWANLLKPIYFPVIIVGIGLAVIQQVTGINVILYYAPIIFKIAGFKGTTSQMLATLGMGVTNFVMTIVALWLVDKVGRRPLLLIGLCLMTAALLTIAILFYYISFSVALEWLCVFSLVIFVAAYALSIGCLFWLLIAEIYPLKIRGKAMSLAASFNWGANLLIAITFLTLLEFVGNSATFFIYGGMGVLSIIFCYFLVPETKKVSLEKIEENLLMGKSTRKLGQE
ncbi:MAG: sugar porter family MFS transporter [Gammaproteobacteria bacterium]